MTRYTVIWDPDAIAMVAELRLKLDDVNPLNEACYLIEKLLRFEPDDRGLATEGNLRYLAHPPIWILYSVDEGDRKVHIVWVELLNEASGD